MTQPDNQLESDLPKAAGRNGVWLRWLAGLAIGALFVWWSARSWPLDTLLRGRLSLDRNSSGDLALILRDGSGPATWSLALWAIAAYGLVLVVIHWLRVMRWRPMLAPFGGASLRVCNRVGAVGFMAVFLLPLRLGELVRPLLLARNTEIAFGTGLSTIAVERVLDGLVVSLALFLVLLQVPQSQLARFPEVQVGAFVALAVFAGALILLGATALARQATIALLRGVIGRVSGGLAERIIGLVTTFVDGLTVLRSPLAIAQFLLLTVAYWGINGVGVWLMARGFGLDVPLSAGYAMMCTVVVGMMIPNSPGNVGSFWTFLLLPAGLWGVHGDAPAAVVFGLAVWLMQTVQVSLFGAWGLWADARARGAQP